MKFLYLKTYYKNSKPFYVIRKKDSFDYLFLKKLKGFVLYFLKSNGNKIMFCVFFYKHIHTHLKLFYNLIRHNVKKYFSVIFKLSETAFNFKTSNIRSLTLWVDHRSNSYEAFTQVGIGILWDKRVLVPPGGIVGWIFISFRLIFRADYIQAFTPHAKGRWGKLNKYTYSLVAVCHLVLKWKKYFN